MARSRQRVVPHITSSTKTTVDYTMSCRIDAFQGTHEEYVHLLEAQVVDLRGYVRTLAELQTDTTNIPLPEQVASRLETAAHPIVNASHAATTTQTTTVLQTAPNVQLPTVLRFA